MSAPGRTWTALACFLIFLTKILAIVPLAPALSQEQGFLAQRWHDGKPLRDAEALAQGGQAYAISSRARLPLDAGSQDPVIPPSLRPIASVSHCGIDYAFQTPATRAANASPFSARAPPATLS